MTSEFEQKLKAIVNMLPPKNKEAISYHLPYIQNPEDFRLFQEYLSDREKWRYPMVSFDTFINSPFYLGIGDTVYPAVRKVCKQILGNKYKEAVFIAGIGCHAKGTQVIMYDGGFKNVEDIEVDDELLGPDGKRRIVEKLYRGKDKMYKIIPIKGEPFIVNANHILSLKQTNSKDWFRYGVGDGGLINISVKDYLNKSNKFKSLYKLWRPEKLAFRTIKDYIPIPPYLLGLWLGDGSKEGMTITIGDKEKELINYVKSFSENRNYKLVIDSNKDNCRDYSIRCKDRSNINLTSELRRLGILFNKHIPHKYKVGNVNQRLSLLAGLIDSDGYTCKNMVYFYNNNLRLCEDVAFIARSLGYAAYIRPKKTKCNGKIFDTYSVNISGVGNELPVLLERKRPTSRLQK